MNVIDFKKLLDFIITSSLNKDSEIHGEKHWQSVALIAFQLIEKVTACNPLIVFLFCLLHDSKRTSDGFDPEHGYRAGLFARSLNNIFFSLLEKDIDLLDAACYAHADGGISYDPTVGVCWDSDRLDLWRVKISPDPKFLSTKAARESSFISSTAGIYKQDHTWNNIFLMYKDLLA